MPPCASAAAAAAPSAPSTPLRSACSAAADADSSPASASVLSASPDAADVSDFSPVLSKSAKRRQARQMGAWRAEESLVRITPVKPALPAGFRTPPPAQHSASKHSSGARASGGHMSVHHSSHHRLPADAPVLAALQEMFPELDLLTLNALWTSLGSFDAVVEHMLTTDSMQAVEDREMERALAASVGAPLSGPARSQPDRLSPLSLDLFYPICALLDLVDLSALVRVAREVRGQVEPLFSGVEGLDFSKRKYEHWEDKKIVSMIQRFTGLQAVSLKNTMFHSWSLLRSALFGRPVASLSFSGCPELTDGALVDLMGLGETLTSLDLSQCEVTDEGLEFIATARVNAPLRKLALSDCVYITSLGVLRVLERCPGLETLDLKGTPVSRSILSFASQASNLKNLNLTRCKKLPAELVISSRFCTLTTLSLQANLTLKDVTLSISTLTALNVSNSKHVQSLTLYTPKLATLNLNGCLILSKIVSAERSVPFASALVHLNTNGCRSITSLGFHALFLSGRATMQTLTCRGCLLLSDANLALLLRDEGGADADGVAAPPSQLRFLDLSGCKSASANAILALHRQVAEVVEQRAAADAQRALEGHAILHGRSRGSFGGKPAVDAQWSGGLDDEEASGSGEESPRQEAERDAAL